MCPCLLLERGFWNSKMKIVKILAKNKKCRKGKEECGAECVQAVGSSLSLKCVLQNGSNYPSPTPSLLLYYNGLVIFA